MEQKQIPSLETSGQKVFFKSSERMDEVESSSVRFVITSPPYWNLKDYEHPSQIGQESYERYLERANSVWDECFRVTKDNGLLAINAGPRRVMGVYRPIAFDVYANIKKWKLIDVFVWYIPNALPQPKHYINRLFDNKYELVLLFAKNYKYNFTFHKIRIKQKYYGVDPRSEKLNPQGRCIGNVVRIPAYRPPNIRQMNYHVAAFPEELVHLFLTAFTDPGDIVLDPFLGSGTTLKVSRILRRRGFGYEINTNLKELIRQRIMESWSPPPLENIDMFFSSATEAGRVLNGPRRPKLSYSKDNENLSGYL